MVIKPKISRYNPIYAPEKLSEGWGIIDMRTGEILKSRQKNRIERYASYEWAKQRAKELNQQEDLKCKDI